jgi:FkbM family methyltransferase
MYKRFFNLLRASLPLSSPTITAETTSHTDVTALPPKTILPIDNLLDCLQKLNFYPKHIVDVGANHGGWTRRMLEVFPTCYYSLLEPQPSLRDSVADLLSNPKIVLHTLGASSKSGNLAFTIVDRDDSCNFRMSAEAAAAEGYKQIVVEVTTLDDLFLHSHLPKPDVIKIDAEGLDLDVLQGSKSLLPTCELLFLEAAVQCKSFPNRVINVISTVEDYGFSLFDITDINRTQFHNALWLVELAFVRKNGPLESQVTRYC